MRPTPGADRGVGEAAWAKRTIGDFSTERCDRAGDVEYPVLSVTKGLGIILQSEKFKKRIASSDTARYKKVAHGEFVYDPMLLWSGTVGRQRRVSEGVVSPAYYVFRTDRTVDGDFLERLLQWERTRNSFAAISQGTNVRRRKAQIEDFFGLSLLLPPLPEQRKIAAILSSVDDAIEGTTAVIDQLQVVKKAMMQELLTRGIPGRHTRFKKTEIGEIPEGWEVARMGDLCLRMFVGIAQAATHAYVSTGGVAIIRTTNVKPNRLKTDDVLRISDKFAAEMASKALRGGDVLTARTGYPGVSVVVPQEFEGAQCFTLLVSRPGPRLLSEFLSHVMNSDFGKGIVARGQAGGAQQNLNVGVFQEALIPLPSTKEQREIVDAMNAVWSREDRESESLDALRSLKSALLSVLLTGEVRVTPDPEPVSVSEAASA